MARGRAPCIAAAFRTESDRAVTLADHLNACCRVHRVYNVPVTRVRPQSAGTYSRFLLIAFIVCVPLTYIPENAAAQSPEPLQGSSTRVPSQDDELAIPRPVFELHSGFWLNLHHFLYEQARLRDQESTSRGKVSGPAQDSSAAESRGA